MDEVTGRDNQIICQALQIAIPIMLKHSMSASNTFDMLRILDSRGNRSNLKHLDILIVKFSVFKLSLAAWTVERRPSRLRNSFDFVTAILYFAAFVFSSVYIKFKLKIT